MAKNLLVDFDEELATPVMGGRNSSESQQTHDVDLTVNERLKLLDTELRLLKLRLWVHEEKNDSGYGDTWGQSSLRTEITGKGDNLGTPPLTPTPAPRGHPKPKHRTPEPVSMSAVASEKDVPLTGGNISRCGAKGLIVAVEKPSSRVTHSSEKSSSESHDTKTVECKLCHKRLHKRSLDRHMKVEHGPRVYYFCKGCSHKNNRSDNLRAHYRDCHPDRVIEVDHIESETYEEYYHAKHGGGNIARKESSRAPRSPDRSRRLKSGDRASKDAR